MYLLLHVEIIIVAHVSELHDVLVISHTSYMIDPWFWHIWRCRGDDFHMWSSHKWHQGPQLPVEENISHMRESFRPWTDLNVTFTAPKCFSPFDMNTFHIHCPFVQSRNISSFLWGHLSRASPIGKGITHHISCLDEIRYIKCYVTLTHFMDQKIGKPMSTLI